MSRIAAILDYWFGPDLDDPNLLKYRKPFWFAGPDYSAKIDAHIKKLFGADYEKAIKGEFEIDPSDIRQQLALLILLDQFSRNLHRGTPGAFAQDAKAVAITRAAIARGDDRKLKCVERMFFYMPLMHGEDRQIQDESLVQYEQLIHDAAPDQRDEYKMLYGKAQIQHGAVHRFGRYPHRNALLGRQSTPEEQAFLDNEEQPGRGSKGVPPPETYGA